MTNKEALNTVGYRTVKEINTFSPAGDCIEVGKNRGIYGLNWILFWDIEKKCFLLFRERNTPNFPVFERK